MTMIERLSRRVGRFPVEVPAALLAAAAVGYLLLLGQAALAASAAGAVLAFIVTWVGLRALEPRRAAPAGMPRFRRADLHPDAPLRRPILAGKEFGSPEPYAPEEALPLPPPVPVVPLPSFLRPGGLQEEPVRYVDEVVRDVPDGMVSPHAPVWFRPAQAEDEAEDVDWEDAPDVTVEPEPEPEPEPPPPTANESVAELMARLEAGLARRAEAGRPVVPDDETRAALRAVADDLREIAVPPRRSNAA